MTPPGPTRLDRARLRAGYERLRPACEAALSALAEEVRGVLAPCGLRLAVKHRVKGFEAYAGKLVRLRRQPEGAAAAVTDVMGLRLVFPFLEDVEQAAALVTGAFEVVEVERRREGQSFREFAYDSVHLLVRIEERLLAETPPHTANVCEIQLRTILQDAWAEVEHELVYKSDVRLPNETIKRKLAALNANLALADLIFQEIRDQQRELRERTRRRRQAAASAVGAPGLPGSVGAPPQGPGALVLARPVGRALGGASRLERALLEALDAHSSQDLETAVALYGQLLRMKSAAPAVRSLVYNHRGMALLGLGRPGEALRDFHRCLRLDAGDARGFANRALAHRMLGNHTRALADCDHALDLDPACADALWARAQTHWELGHVARALADCEETLTLRPGFGPARELAARLGARRPQGGPPGEG